MSTITKVQHFASFGRRRVELELVESMAWSSMENPLLDPDVADLAPTESSVTKYDEEHVVTYLRLLDANKEQADWAVVARIVLHIDPEREPERARIAFDSHLARAKWMARHGYRHLLRGGALD